MSTEHVAYDVTDLGGGTLEGVAAIRDAALAMGDRNPVGHHITNVILEEVADGEVRALGRRMAIARRVPLGAG